VQVPFSTVSRVWGFCVLLDYVCQGEKSRVVLRGIGELPVQICTEVKFGILFNWQELYN